MTHQNTMQQAGFLRLKQIIALYPISKSGWWKGVAEGRFPRPVKLGLRAVGWRASDIYAFLGKVSSQDSKLAEGGKINKGKKHGS